MGFSGLLIGASSSATRPRAPPSSTSPNALSLVPTTSAASPIASRDGPSSAPPELISDPSQLDNAGPEAPDLRELNAALEALAVVFPDIQMDVFREMLSHFDGESRLALVADNLLKNRLTWVKGRWRTAGADDARAPIVPVAERFRSPQYRRAVQVLAWHEFRGLSKSTVNAVLAESNYSYLDARRTLVALSSKSWRFTISNMFSRRKPVRPGDAHKDPLIVWRPSGNGAMIPCMKPTGNAELDRELYADLIEPLRERARAARLEEDHRMAMALNNQEAEETQGALECACCFTESPFEEFTACNGEGHMICFRCVQHSITEAVFGQGWQRGIDKETGTLRCPAVDSHECKGCIPADLMLRAMLEERKGAEIMHKLEQRLAEHSLMASGLPLIRCPFCSYAEVDDIYVPASEASLQLRADGIYNLILLVLCLGAVPFLVTILLISSLVALLLAGLCCTKDWTSVAAYAAAEFRAAVSRQRRRRRGLKFPCGNADECGRTSCLGCGKEWVDLHVCHESALVALRTQVEQAMSMAIKRVCPRCNTSFVKTAGCNKLTCPCGYKMCYVCRKDIGGVAGEPGGGDGPGVGYRHFCDHFRPEGDPRQCSKCNKCNLWESENTDEVLRQAKAEAERRWRETERRELSGAERAFLETGVAAHGAGGRISVARMLRGRWPTVGEVCEFVVENLFA